MHWEFIYWAQFAAWPDTVFSHSRQFRAYMDTQSVKNRAEAGHHLKYRPYLEYSIGLSVSSSGKYTILDFISTHLLSDLTHKVTFLINDHFRKEGFGRQI